MPPASITAGGFLLDQKHIDSPPLNAKILKILLEPAIGGVGFFVFFQVLDEGGRPGTLRPVFHETNDGTK